MSASESAYSFLCRYIETCRQQGQSHLEPIPSLARQCGVSPCALRNALKRLESEEQIDIRPRRGVFLRVGPLCPAEPVPALPPEPIGTKRERVRERIMRDTLNGLYPAGLPLPSYKALCDRYGVSRPTLRRIFGSLLRAGLLEHSTSGYRVSSGTDHSSVNQLVVISRTDNVVQLADMTPRSAEMWRSLEQVSNARSVAIKVISVSGFLELYRRLGNAAAQRLAGPHGSVLGFLVLTLGLTSDEEAETYQALVSLTIRAVFLDEMGEHPEMLSRRNRMICRVHCGCTDAPGRIVGQHLIGLGHMRSAFLTTVMTHQWHEKRVRGLRSAYLAAGPGFDISVIGLDSVPDYKEVFAVVEKSDAYRQLVAHRQRYPELFGHELAALADRFYSDQAMGYLSAHYWYALMHPLFDKAYAREDISAWACVTDLIGILAIDYLGKHPQRSIAVVGFDDTPDALRSGLSSYNFNIPAVVRFVFDYLGGRYSSSTLQNPVVIDGVVTHRRSSFE